MARIKTSVWLPRVLFESALITVSILLALGLDEWREDRQDQETVELAMANFLSEIRRNKARVEDAAPFNSGLHNVLQRRHAEGDVGSVNEFISVVDSYTSIVLQSTAWETALATGSVAKMDYDLVSALSLTYGLQSRYLQASRPGVLDLTNPQLLTEDYLEVVIYNAIRHLREITAMESELAIVYEEAERVILDAWMDMNEATLDDAVAWASAPSPN